MTSSIRLRRMHGTKSRPRPGISRRAAAAVTALGALFLVPDPALAQTGESEPWGEKPASPAATAAPSETGPDAAPADRVAPTPEATERAPADGAPAAAEAAPPPNQADTPPPPAQSDVEPPDQEEALPPIHVAAWLRMGARFQGSNPEKINDGSLDTVYGELHAGGKIHDNVSVTLNLNANGLAGTAGIEDAIIGFDFHDAFHVWLGQLLVPVDRANFAGPFFMIPWNYPGFLTVGDTTVVMAPKEGPYGRNAGAVVWGDFFGGKLKYMAGAFDNGDATTTPLFSGRLTASLVGEEPGFFGNATYFGEKDVVTIGVGQQYQKDGNVGPDPMTGEPPPTDDYSEFNADVLAEFRYGGGGWVTGEAGYYRFNGEFQGITDSFYAMAAIATPKLGIGNIQPMVRYQYGKGEGDLKVSSIDAAIGYLVKGPALRFTANYQRTDLGPDAAGEDVIGNAVQLGAQAIFF